jgi:hypothetical protein
MTYGAILFAVVLALPWQYAIGAETEAAAKQAVQQVTRKLLQLPPNHYLRVTRREDLEDDLFTVQLMVRGKIRKAAYFFEVTETGFEIVSPEEVLFHSSVDGQTMWIAAVDTESGRVFPLLGYPDASATFNELIKVASVRITDETAAARLAILFFASTLGSQFGEPYHNRAQLRYQVEEALAGQKFSVERWLRSAPKKLHFGFEFRKRDSGYVGISEMLKRERDKPPSIQRVSFTIEADGTVTTPSVTTIYAPGK